MFYVNNRGSESGINRGKKRKCENKIIDSREAGRLLRFECLVHRSNPYEPRIRKEPNEFRGQLYRSNEKNSSPFFSHGRRRPRDDASS